jgi:Flp pilus assembly protein TadD
VKGDFAPFHRKIGISLELTAQTAEAERAYRRCLELDPRDMPTHQDLAIMIAIKGVRRTSSSFLRRSVLLIADLIDTPCRVRGC